LWLERQTSGEVTVDTEELDEKKIYQIAIGDFESRTQVTELKGGYFDLSFDLRAVEDSLRQSPMASDPQMQALLDTAAHLAQGQLEYRDLEFISTGRLRFHGGGLPALEIPETGFDLATPAPIDRCIDRLRRASRRIIDSDHFWRHDGEFDYEQAFADFEEVASTCDDDEELAELVQWLRSRWRAGLSNYLIEDGRWDEALEFQTKACDLHYSQACERAAALGKFFDAHQFAGVDTTRFYLSHFDGQIPILNEAGLQWLTVDVFTSIAVGGYSPQELETAVKESQDHWKISEIGTSMPVSLVHGIDDRLIPAAVVSISPETPLEPVRHIVHSAMIRATPELDHQAFQRGGAMHHPDQPTWTAVIVDAKSHEESSDELPVVLLAGPDHLHRSERRHIQITVDSDPSTIVVDGQTLAIDDLAAHLDSIDIDGAPAFIIDADSSTTFAELLTFHEPLDQWFAKNFDEPMLFVTFPKD
jgi:hypothetical protein